MNIGMKSYTRYKMINTLIQIQQGVQRHYSQVGFIGLGNMGSHMARNVLKNGHDVIVYDTNKDASQQLAKEGANMVLSLSTLASSCQYIVSMLPANDHVLNTYSGPDSILNHVKPNTILIDSSTVDPEVPRKISKLAYEKNISFLDAPVSGGTKAAEQATLTFMVGGNKTALEKAEPIFQCMGRNVFYCGDSGNGQVAKLCNNMLLGISMMGVAEALNLGIKLGMDAKLLSEVINNSSGRCWSSEVYNPVPEVLPNVPSSCEYNGGFKVNLLVKDMTLANILSERSGANTDLATLTRKTFEHLIEQGYQDKDFSYIYEYLKNKK